MNTPILAPKHLLKPCKHGVKGLCVKCRYLNTGRRKSTDSFVEADVVDFMNSGINKRLRN